MSALRTDLRSLPSLVGTSRPFDVEALPDDPAELFATWFEDAVAAGAPEPHAMTLSTVDGDGRPDARVVIMKQLSDDGRWGFAGGADSAKGRQLAARPDAALTFWWSALIRSVRLRGPVEPADPAISAADFADRSVTARAVAAAGPTSTPLEGLATQRSAVERAARALERGEAADTDWTLWWLRPTEIEFWQGAPDRQHIRVRYHRSEQGWTHHLLWT